MNLGIFFGEIIEVCQIKHHLLLQGLGGSYAWKWLNPGRNEESSLCLRATGPGVTLGVHALRECVYISAHNPTES